MFSKEFKQAVNEIINDYNLDIFLLVAIIIFSIYIFFIAPKIFVNTTDAVIDGRLINVTSRVGGPITQAYIMKDQEVKKGDLLVEIDSADYKEELTKLETDLQINKEKLKMFGVPVEIISNNENPENENNDTNEEASAPPKYKQGSNDITKYSKTYEPESLQEKNIQRKRIAIGDTIKNMSNPIPEDEKITVPNPDTTKIDITNDTVESVQQEIKDIEKQKEEVKLLLSSCKIYAPRDGIVSSVSVKIGDVVNPSDVLCTLIPKQVWIIARVNPARLEQIRVGQPVKIKVPKYKRRTFKGTISAVDKTLKVYQIKAHDEIIQVNSEGFVEKEPTPAYQIKIDFIEDYSDFNLQPDTQVQARIQVQ